MIGVRQLVGDGGAVQRGKGHGLHGDELDFAGESPARICATRHPVDVLEDGGRGQLLICAIQRRRRRRRTWRGAEEQRRLGKAVWDECMCFEKNTFEILCDKSPRNGENKPNPKLQTDIKHTAAEGGLAGGLGGTQRREKKLLTNSVLSCKPP